MTPHPHTILNPLTVAMVNRAYAAAMDVLTLRPSLFHGMTPLDARATLGRAMMDLVEAGSYDEASLVREALLRAFPACRSRPGILLDHRVPRTPAPPLDLPDAGPAPGTGRRVTSPPYRWPR